MTSYYVVDAPGYHGDWVRVYRVCRTLEAARKYIGRETMFGVVAAPTGSYAKREMISRAVSLSYVR